MDECTDSGPAICAHCGLEFTRRRAWARFCSTGCRMVFHGRTKEDKFRALRERARVLTQKAIRAGRLVPGPCQTCGAAKTVPHHEDYARPMEVTWLCRTCHGKQPPNIHSLIPSASGLGGRPRLHAKGARWVSVCLPPKVLRKLGGANLPTAELRRIVEELLRALPSPARDEADDVDAAKGGKS